MSRPIAPYVTPWTGEAKTPIDVVVTSSGVAYADPVHDALARDLDGTLWELRGGTATGRPEYADLHPERQPAAMNSLLCAGCNQPAARDERGMLWLLPLVPLLDSVTSDWEGVRTTIPPMCEACTEETARLCPRMREGHVKLRAREAELIGVRGTLHPRPGETCAPEPDALVLYDSPDMPFVVARHVVRELCRTTLVALAVTTALPRTRPVQGPRVVTG
ncbi:hypothetical protein FRZ03_27810 [Streptomyces misionensis]|uniref:Uncharacterized protein n=1 Tax=Streptomyces misionensis TaxID=67331 RepID=A0A5C6J2R7_9ACTN|nr:hypothetical protein [Streptomyces misionensis]TWV34905.1 hypothetical protein FRZ03_27810 [Streptomyces misionensis]